jgi:hypothetical protein
MTRRRLVWVASFTLLLGTAAQPAAETTPAYGERTPALRDEPLTQYRAYRRLYARAEKMDQEGWLEAWTELDERGFRFQVVSERGSEQVRSRVLRAVLKREQELLASGDVTRSALSSANYEFGEPDVQSTGVQHVTLKPKRKDTLLVDGHMVLSPDGRELLRVEGRLAKNPSFWTSLVNIIRRYARVDGVRVPVATESVAKVKLVGMSRLDVHYEYETINGRPVSPAARQMMASAAGR